MNKIYETLSDGTVIDDEYISRTLDSFDEMLKVPDAEKHNCVEHEPLSIRTMPKSLYRELKPFLFTAVA